MLNTKASGVLPYLLFIYFILFIKITHSPLYLFFFLILTQRLLVQSLTLIFLHRSIVRVFYSATTSKSFLWDAILFMGVVTSE